MTNTIKSLNTRAKKLVANNAISATEQHEFLVDAITVAQANGDNFTPIGTLYNGLVSADKKRIKAWLKTYAPIRFSIDKASSMAVLKLNKADDAPSYDPELGSLNPFWNIELQGSGAREFDLESSLKSLSKRIAKNAVITEDYRSELHALLDTMLDDALAHNKVKVAKAA